MRRGQETGEETGGLEVETVGAQPEKLARSVGVAIPGPTCS